MILGSAVRLPCCVTLRPKGYELVTPFGHAGSVSGRGRFVYLLTEGHPGTIVELFNMSHGRERVFAGIAAAAHHWDGRDPIRTALPTG